MIPAMRHHLRMRVFFGLAIPDTLRLPLALARDVIPAGRAVPDENLHLTLAFLEDVDETTLAEVDLHLSGMALPQARIGLDALQTFGEPPRVIAAGIHPDAGLTGLHAAIGRALRAAGIVPRRERFRPHITLRRLRRTDVLGRLDPVLPALSAPVDALTLWQSDLRPEGPRYTVLARYPLIG